MKPQAWAMVWKTIRDHERKWINVAARTIEPGSKEILRRFFRAWDPWYVDSMDVAWLMSQFESVPDERFRAIVKALWNAREQASAINLGNPKISASTMKIIRAYLSIPLTTISGEAVSMHIPASFRASLVAQISEDHVLTLQGCHRDRSFSTSVDLKPIAACVGEMIRRYHANVLHGDMQEETIAGLGDWYKNSVRIAARIANAKAAKRLWGEVQKHHGKIEAGLTLMGPFGAAAAVGMRTGFTVQKMLSKAKAGDPSAVKDVKAIVALSKQGDPSAGKVTVMMRAMNEMGKLKDAKVGESVSGWWWNRPYRVIAVTPDMALRGLYNLGLAA